MSATLWRKTIVGFHREFDTVFKRRGVEEDIAVANSVVESVKIDLLAVDRKIRVAARDEKKSVVSRGVGFERRYHAQRENFFQSGVFPKHMGERSG